MKNPKIIPLFPNPITEGSDIELAKKIQEVNIKEKLYSAKDVFNASPLLRKKVQNVVNEHLKHIKAKCKGKLSIKYYGGVDNEYDKPDDNSILTGVVMVNLKKGAKKITLFNPYSIDNDNIKQDKNDNPYVDYSFIKVKGDVMLFDSKMKFDVEIGEEEMILIFDVILN